MQRQDGDKPRVTNRPSILRCRAPGRVLSASRGHVAAAASPGGAGYARPAPPLFPNAGGVGRHVPVELSAVCCAMQRADPPGAPWPRPNAATPPDARLLLASRGPHLCAADSPDPLQSCDDRTSARTVDDELAWPVPNTQRGWHAWRRRDDHSPPGARCTPDRRGELEDKPRRTANSVLRDRGLQRRPGARPRLGRPARRGTRTNVVILGNGSGTCIGWRENRSCGLSGANVRSSRSTGE